MKSFSKLIIIYLGLISLSTLSVAATKKDSGQANSSSPSFVTDGAGYQYEYGVIPVTATLCSSVGLGGGVGAGAFLGAGLEGEAGGGVTFIGKINGQAALNAGAELAAGISSSMGISTSNCLPLIDTKSPTDFSNLNPEEAYFHRALVSNTLGEDVDTNEMAISVMRQATNLQASLATSRVVLANVGVINKQISSMITEGDPLNFNKMKSSLIRVAHNSTDLLHPRLKRQMVNLDKIFAKHASNIDILGKSCNDLYSGNITHLPPLMIARMDTVCNDWKEVQDIVETFIDDVNGTFEKTGEAAKQMASLAKNGESLKALVSSFDNSLSEINQTANALGGGVSQLSDSVAQSKEVLNKSVSGAQEVMTASINVMNETVTEVNSATSNAASSTSTGLQDLKGEVDTTVTLIKDLTFGNITAMPGKIVNKITAVREEIADSVCTRGISGPLGFSVEVKDIPGVSGILGC